MSVVGSETSTQYVEPGTFVDQMLKGGVSGAVRYLTQVRMIRRERERGSRRDVYVVMDDAWHDMLMQSDQAYRPILEALAVARGAVEEGTRAWERMQLSVEFLEFITREMGGIAERWDEYKAARG